LWSLAEPARIIAAGHALDLDHIGTHIGQHLAASRRRHDVAHLDYLEAMELAGVAVGHV
jgi:hypothetical protein